MSKYAPLWGYVQKNGSDRFKLTFEEIQAVAGIPIDHSFLKYKKELTAYGYQVTAGRTIAVDPKVIPIGSEVVINGHTYVAEDVGGVIKENRIDIYFNTHQEALEFGVQYAEVFINQ